jgi:hypothetical protein
LLWWLFDENVIVIAMKYNQNTYCIMSVKKTKKIIVEMNVKIHLIQIAELTVYAVYALNMMIDRILFERVGVVEVLKRH